ncbi:MAG: head GIN domain-containing protein [Chloroflexota bacterium]
MTQGTTRRSFLRRGVELLTGGMILTLPFGCRGDYIISAGGGPRVVGSGKVVAKDFPLADFSALEAANGFRVEVRRADGFAVRVSADDNILDYLRVEKQGDTLRLGLRNGNYNNITLRAEVSLPQLRAVNLSGGSNAGLNGFKNEGDFLADLSGAARLDGELVAAKARCGLSGGSNVTLSGSANRLEIEASGGSKANFVSFAAKEVDARLSGGSEATVAVEGKLDVKADGGSNLYYTGNPTLGRQDLSGGSSVRRR